MVGRKVKIILIPKKKRMKVFLNSRYLSIQLDILEKIGAAKGTFHIPYKNIISVLSEEPHSLKGFKIAGTNIPKVLEIGTYLVGTQKQFWYIKTQKNNFLVLVLKANFYSKIILEVKDSHILAEKINEKLEKL